MEELLARFITDENMPLELKAVERQLFKREPMPLWSSKSGGRYRRSSVFYVAQAPQPDAPTGFNLVADDLACKVSNSALAQILNLHSRMVMKSWCLLATVAGTDFHRCGRKSGANERLAEYFNPTFTLHLLEESIAEAWVTVNRPAMAT